jgi:predicted ATPase/class 3 adenylate cyclase
LAEQALGQGETAEAVRRLRLLVAADPLRESGHRLLMRALATSGDYAAATEVYRELRLLLHRELNATPTPESTTLYEQLRAEGRRKASGQGEAVGSRVPSGRSAVGTEGGNWLPAAPPPQLPGGTLTLLLTDVEDSSGLLERHGEAMRRALARHNELIVAGVKEHGGVISHLQGEGDSSFCLFEGPMEALVAACAIQRALAAEAWPMPEALRVRMALYTGTAEVIEGRYQGIAIHRCARLRELARGGQILVGESTHDLVRDELRPEEVGWRLQDLGVYRLRGLSRPERIYQLSHPELPAGAAALPLRPIGRGRLPQQLTSLVGRTGEVQEVKGRLAAARLVTLTGTGGVGKTRLAIQAAEEVEGDYLESAWFVDLSALSSAGLVTQAVASVLGVREEPGRPLGEILLDFLRPKSLLLVLDNCEHLLEAAAQLAEQLLRGCPNLRILATSREGLGIIGEQTYRVPSLSLPDLRELPRPEQLGRQEAVQLFVERARLGLPHFGVTPENALAVAEVCCRLDGIPLALELAAARVKALPVEKLNERLDDRFRLLTGGSRTALPRQQTLRGTIDWSYDLLSEPERVLLRRLSVFGGGWTLEAAEAVCGDCGLAGPEGGVSPESRSLRNPQSALRIDEVLDLLTALVEKSLVLYEESPGRYRLLETVRQYARDRLLEAGEADAVQGRHLDWFLALAEEARRELFGPEQRAWLDRLEGEHDNMRSALAWSEVQERGTAGLRLGAALWRFWSVRGYLAEGCERLESVLSHPGASAPTVERASALDGAGYLAMNCGDFTRACTVFEEALSIGQELGDQRVIATACNSLGDARRFQGDVRAARSLYEEALRLGRGIDDQWSLAYSLTALGGMVAGEGNYAAARSLLAEGLTIKRALGDKRSIAYSLNSLAGLSLAEENTRGARSLYEETLRIGQELGDKRGIALSLSSLGLVARAEGDFLAARARFAESLEIFGQVGDRRGVADSLKRVAEVAATQGESELAARSFGAAQRLREDTGAPLPPADRAEHDCSSAGLRTALGEEAFDQAWAEGRAMSLAEAIACALGEAPEG